MLDTLDIATNDVVIADAARRRDPCQCSDLRGRLATSMQQVVAALQNSIRNAVSDNDMLSLNSVHSGAWAMNARSEAFNGYITVALRRLIANATGVANAALRSSYDRGIKAARKELDITGHLPGRYIINDLSLTAASDVAAIATVTQAALMRQAQLAIAGRDTAYQAYRRMQKDAIKRIAAVRLDTMATTLITSGYNNGKLDVYENAGNNDVHVIAEATPHSHHDSAETTDAASTAQLGRMAAERREKAKTRLERERARKAKAKAKPQRTRPTLPGSRAQFVTLLTAGDMFVCPICEDLEGTTYTVAYARRLLPVHPRCRCVVVPAGDKRFSKVPIGRSQ